MNWPEAIFLIFATPCFYFTVLVILAVFLDILRDMYWHLREEYTWHCLMKEIKKLSQEEMEKRKKK